MDVDSEGSAPTKAQNLCSCIVMASCILARVISESSQACGRLGGASISIAEEDRKSMRLSWAAMCWGSGLCLVLKGLGILN